MIKENEAYTLAAVLLFGMGIALTLSVTRPLWAKERVLHEGILTAHYAFGNVHEFHFSDNTTITETGWLWKTYLRTNRQVCLLKKNGAIVVKEVSEPAIAA